MRIAVIVLFLAIGTIVSAQVQPGQPTPQQPMPGQPTAPGQPQRMPARPLRPGETPPKGTAVIRGQVLTAGTGAPIRRAQVRAMAPEARGNGVTNTDAEGRFEIKELPAGRYNVTVTKGGYVTGQFGQRRPGEPGTPIELSDGQVAAKVNFVLARGSVIAGRIYDDNGEPVSGTQVSAMRYGFMGGIRRLMPASSEGGTDRTDDQGGFRLYGLPPGDYYVAANNRNGMVMMAELNNTEADGYAPTYYPGTPNLTEAQRISLRIGQEMTGANFALTVARLARVRGRALNSRGEPATTRMIMMAPADPSNMMIMMGMNNAMVGPDGSFQFSNVAPGRYNINVRPMGMPGGNDEFAVVPITVGSEDIDNVIISTSLGATARGVIVTDDGSIPSFRHDQVQIMAQPAEPMVNIFGGGPPRVNDDYSFELTSLSDRRIVRGSVGMGQPLGWYLKAVIFEGEDVTDTGIEFTPGRAYEGLQVVFTQKATDLSGTVTDERGKPVLDATVIIFPANRDRWGYQTRYIRAVRPDTEGRYNVKSMPPFDDYLVIAVQNLEQGQGNDPEFLERARELARPFSLNEGETKAVDVKLSTLVP